VIVTAIGYPNTTGLPAVDWRLVDTITDPPGSEALCTERLLRLDPCFLCYSPPEHAPSPVMPPDDAPITFGSFNSTLKIVPETTALWSRVMQAVPDARLLLKSTSMRDAAARERLLHDLAAAGIDGSRVELIAYAANRDDHLRLYNRVHNGTTTTCEALWMGVPVLTTLGDRHAARVSASLLTALGHPEWIATSPDMFVETARALTADRARLADLRGSLRAAMQASPLCDSASYAKRLHAALRACWRDHCAAHA
jgi:predicted O-linked N-acetylglucosamine transferase (SPINDLY family)